MVCEIPFICERYKKMEVSIFPDEFWEIRALNDWQQFRVVLHYKIKIIRH